MCEYFVDGTRPTARMNEKQTKTWSSGSHFTYVILELNEEWYSRSQSHQSLRQVAICSLDLVVVVYEDKFDPNSFGCVASQGQTFDSTATMRPYSGRSREWQILHFKIGLVSKSFFHCNNKFTLKWSIITEPIMILKRTSSHSDLADIRTYCSVYVCNYSHAWSKSLYLDVCLKWNTIQKLFATLVVSPIKS